MLAALTVLVGCVHEDPFIPPAGTPGLPFPDTPDQLMQNFRTAYETMDITEITRLMDPTFVTILQQVTTTRFPAVGPTLDVLEETRIHERMFSKQSVVDPVGLTVPGIQTINFQTFECVDTWAPSLWTDPIPNTTCARYDVTILFDRGGSFAEVKARGMIKFYVMQRDSVVAGVDRPYYRMVGQLDLTQDSGKASQTTAWGTVKAFFR